MDLGRRNPTLEDLWMKNFAQTRDLFGCHSTDRITWSSSKTFQRTTENKDRWKMISYSGIAYFTKQGSVTFFSYQLQSKFNMNGIQSDCISLQIWILIEIPDDLFGLNWNNPSHSGFHGIQTTSITPVISCCADSGFLLLYHAGFNWAFLQYTVLITDHSDHRLLLYWLNISLSGWNTGPLRLFLEQSIRLTSHLLTLYLSLS